MAYSDRARATIGEGRVVERNDRAIEYFVMGKGVPVFLIASAGREASDFNELATDLAGAGFQTIAVEPPGIGKSALPVDGGMDLFDLAVDLTFICDHEGWADPVFAIGHAFGNRAVRAFATKYPERTKAVVLIAAGGAKPIPERASQALFSCFDESLSPEAHLEHVRYGFFADGNDVPDYWRRGWHPATATVQGQATRALDPDVWTGAGSAPMLVLQAASDTIAPPEDAGEALKRRFPERVELVVVPQAGHALLPEQPDFISQQVIKYMRTAP